MIEKNVPIPPLKRRNKRISAYPFSEMEIGDSFAVDREKASSVSASAYLYGKKEQQIFTVRRVDGGYRCWRIG